MNEIEKGQLAISTVQCFTKADGNLSHLPGLIRRVIEERVWEGRVHNGRFIELASLRELVTEMPIAGWGQDPAKIEALIKDDPEALALWREEMKGKAGRPKHDEKSRSNTTELDRGKAYTCARLKRESPELFAQVVAGELSANAAAIKAGFRKKPTPFEQAMKLLPKLSGDEWDELCRAANSLFKNP